MRVYGIIFFLVVSSGWAILVVTPVFLSYFECLLMMFSDSKVRRCVQYVNERGHIRYQPVREDGRRLWQDGKNYYRMYWAREASSVWDFPVLFYTRLRAWGVSFDNELRYPSAVPQVTNHQWRKTTT